MRLVRFQAGGTVHRGVRRGDAVYSLSAMPSDPTWERLADPAYRDRIRRRIDRGRLRARSADDVLLCSPVARPSKLLSVGLNYPGHVAEQDADQPDRPLLFSKAPSAIVGPGDRVVLPDAVDQVDYEVELAVVVGRTARSVPAADVDRYVAGYTIINDVSARDAQFEDGQFFRGKSYDTFAPLGPAVVTDGFDPTDADIGLEIDGVRRQQANTGALIFDVGELFAFVSDVMTLEPGDVVATGTPGGVGIFSDPPKLLQAGDTVTCHVEGIGSLTNPVVAEGD